MAGENPDLAVILSRLEIVERQNRILRRAGMIAALLVAMVLIMGQAKPDRTINADTVIAGRIVADTIQLYGQDGATSTILEPGFMTVQTKGKNFVFIRATSEGPSLQLIDKEGFQAALGMSSLATIKTGEKRRSSAASVILFGKDEKVLWSAP